MADNTDAPDTGAEEQQDGQNGTDTEPDWKAEAEKWKGLARKHEDQWKSNADKVAEYDRLVEASKTDQERLEERASKAEGRLGSLETENMRLKVALEKGLPADLIERLRGTTPEELAKDADFLLERFAKPTQQPDLRAAAGQRPTRHEQSADDWIRSMAGRG